MPWYRLYCLDWDRREVPPGRGSHMKRRGCLLKNWLKTPNKGERPKPYLTPITSRSSGKEPLLVGRTLYFDSWTEIVAFCHEPLKWDQNPWFIPYARRVRSSSRIIWLGKGSEMTKLLSGEEQGIDEKHAYLQSHLSLWRHVLSRSIVELNYSHISNE